MFNELLDKGSAKKLEPSSLTILPTYRCTAACKECCFESSPNLKSRLSKEEIFEAIISASNAFDNLRLIVFSGGECFTLKNDLYESIALASERGLKTRCVTNGYWGNTVDNANRVASMLGKSKLTEINFSSGLDHSKYVDVNTVINAARAVIKEGINTTIVVEKDSKNSSVLNEFYAHSQFQELSKSELFSIRTNSWMPFKKDFEDRGDQSQPLEGKVGCDQVFDNLVVTPHNLLSGCCGLTFEHIPEMKIGDLKTDCIKESYENQFNDFLKYWLRVDGPIRIIERLLSAEEIKEHVGKIDHICQACVHVHKNPYVTKILVDKYKNYQNEVIARFELSTLADKAKSSLQKASLIN